MKLNINKFIGGCAILCAAAACTQQGIDDITSIPQGDDLNAPVITISYPSDGQKIRVVEEITSVNIQLRVEDDVEVASIAVSLDGTEITSFDQFPDYRIAIKEYLYDQLGNGVHTLSVVATDISGKTSTEEVVFEKIEPYKPLFDNETFYMPFDGDYTELISITDGSKTGMPSFADGKAGKSYKGTDDAYLTFPTAGVIGNEFSAAFWYKIDATADRAGILVSGNEDDPSSRKNGFRLFREGSAETQRIKANVGTGGSDAWNDGALLPVDGEWVHIVLTISETQSKIYVNGVVANTKDNGGAIDWTGCNNFTIGAGGETFNYWNHNSDGSNIDELRIFDRAINEIDIMGLMDGEPIKSDYTPVFDGESFYMPFSDNFIEQVGYKLPSSVGTPAFSTGKDGQGYKGSEGSYLTYPTNSSILTDAFSATFWYKVDATADRASMLVVGAPDTENEADKQNNRKFGFRLFREGTATVQKIKLNVGNGEADSWFDGGAAAEVAVDGEWVHVAFTISDSECVVYIDGEVVKQGDFSGVNWDGCDLLSIMSGNPRFNGWSHTDDPSEMDELRLYTKALTQDEVKATMN